MANTKFHRERRTSAFFKTFAYLLEEYRQKVKYDWIDSPDLMKIFNQACTAVGGEPVADNGFVSNGRVCQNFYAALASMRDNLRILGADSYLLFEGNKNETGGFQFVLEYDNFIKYIDSIGDTALKIRLAKRGTSSSKKRKSPTTSKKEPQGTPIVKEKPAAVKRSRDEEKDVSSVRKRVIPNREMRLAFFVGLLVNYLKDKADYGVIAKVISNNDFHSFKEYDRPRDNQLAYQFWAAGHEGLGDFFKLRDDIVSFKEGWNFESLKKAYIECRDRTKVFCVLPLSEETRDFAKNSGYVTGSVEIPEKDILPLVFVCPNWRPSVIHKVSQFRGIFEKAIPVLGEFNFIIPEDTDIDERDLINFHFGLTDKISERALNNILLILADKAE